VKQLGSDYVDYWMQFQGAYETAVQTAFGGFPAMAGLRGMTLYCPDMLVGCATAGYELEVLPAEAVGLMVVVQAYYFRETHGKLRRLLQPSVRSRTREHDSMLRAVSPQVIHFRKHPIIGAFAERVVHHLQKDLERHSNSAAAAARR
jgi:hypothetical protein